MAFQKKTWKDRITEFPTRRTLTKSDGSTEIVTVARAEGTVSQEGDAFNAASMNDLEERISQANNDLNNSLSALGGFEPVIDSPTGKITGYKTTIGGADTVFPFNSSIGLLFKSYIEKYLLLKEENSLAMVGGTILLQSKQSTYCYAICAYKNKIDFANYNKIKLTYTCKKSALVGINSIIPASPTISGDIFNIYLSETSTFTETAIDIANLKTSGYLFFRTNVYQSEINITKIELE